MNPVVLEDVAEIVQIKKREKKVREKVGGISPITSEDEKTEKLP